MTVAASNWTCETGNQSSLGNWEARSNRRQSPITVELRPARSGRIDGCSRACSVRSRLARRDGGTAPVRGSPLGTVLTTHCQDAQWSARDSRANPNQLVSVALVAGRHIPIEPRSSHCTGRRCTAGSRTRRHLARTQSLKILRSPR